MSVTNTNTPTSEQLHLLTAKPSSSRRIVSHYNYHGKIDEWFGVSMFWREKFSLVITFIQRLALLWIWKLDYPVFFYRRTTFIPWFLLDPFARHRNVSPTLASHECDQLCAGFWFIGAWVLLLLWGCVGFFKKNLTYTRNAERLLYFILRIVFLPIVSSVMRYGALQQTGDSRSTNVVSGASIAFIVLGILYLIVFFGLLFRRTIRQCLFSSRIRHEAYVQARELEYKLKLSCMYRNERIFMISSFTQAAWYNAILHFAVDAWLVLWMSVAPDYASSVVGCATFTLLGIRSTVFVRVYRTVSSHIVYTLLHWALALDAFLGVLQVYGVRNPLLVDKELENFLIIFNCSVLGLLVVLAVYWFQHSHSIYVSPSLADTRAAKKWESTFGELNDGKEPQVQEQAQLERKPTLMAQLSMRVKKNKARYLTKTIYDEDIDKLAEVDLERFAEGLSNTAVDDHFYLPPQGAFFVLNATSKHLWPVNATIVNELLRDNARNHYIDVLRSAKRQLEMVGALHRTPELVPCDSLLKHIRLLRRCLKNCKKERVTHHSHLQHPLQRTLEDMLEQLVFEVRTNKLHSLTTGKKARKMIIVSRFLHRRMIERDRHLALYSKMMRRIILKLVALRTFQQLLLKSRPDYLLPVSRSGQFMRFEGMGSVASSNASQTPFADNALSPQEPDAVSATEEGGGSGVFGATKPFLDPSQLVAAPDTGDVEMSEVPQGPE